MGTRTPSYQSTCASPDWPRQRTRAESASASESATAGPPEADGLWHATRASQTRPRARAARRAVMRALGKRENKDPVAHTRRLVIARRLERHALAVARHHGVRRLVALVVSPMREADEVGAVGRQLQLPEVDVARVLAVRTLLAARLDERPRPVGRDPLHFVVLIGQLAIRRQFAGGEIDAHHVGIARAVAGVDELGVIVAEVLGF